MVHERHVSRTLSGKRKLANNHNGDLSNNNQNEFNNSMGVRQRAVPVQCSARVETSNSTPTNISPNIWDNAGIQAMIPPPPLSTGAPRLTSSKIFDALVHPVQAAAAAAAATSRQGPRFRKRKSVSLILLTVVCGAVVYYSATMYDYDDYFADAENPRKALLRNPSSKTSAMAFKDTAFTRIMHPRDNSNNKKSKQHMTPRQKLVRDRIVNTIKSAFVADAASMGTHWIYNLSELESSLLSKDQPEFRTPPVPRYYNSDEFPGHYGPGQASPYGEQFLFVLDYAATMASSPDTLRRAGTPEQFVDDDDEDQPYSILEPMSAAMQKWATTFGGREDHAMLQFLSCRRKRVHDLEANLAAVAPKPIDDDDAHKNKQEEMENSSCGADDDQAHFFLKVIPMTCLYVGHPHRKHYVEQAIRVHQNNNNAVLLGLALSDLLERVLLMEDTEEAKTETPNASSDNNNKDSLPLPQLPPAITSQQATSLRDALDKTLLNLEEQHGDGWFHFADSWTTRHQQQETLLDSWRRAQKSAEKKKSIAQVASAAGKSCHMPGALIVSLHALYRAANAEAKTTTVLEDDKNSDKSTGQSSSAAITQRLGYDYFFKYLLKIQIPPKKEDSREENPLLVAAIRGNILAAGDTCSRAILIGAVLGAAYGGPPSFWWERMYPVLSGQVEEAAYSIADYAVQNLNEQRY